MSNAEKSNSPRGARGRGRGRGLQRATPPERPRGRVEPDSEVERLLKTFRSFDPGLTALVRFDQAYKAIETLMVFDRSAFVRAGIEPVEGLPVDEPTGGIIHTPVQAYMVKRRIDDKDRDIRRSMRSNARLGKDVGLSELDSLKKEDLLLLDMPASQYEKLHGKSNQNSGARPSSSGTQPKVSRAQDPMGSAAPSTSSSGNAVNYTHARKWSDSKPDATDSLADLHESASKLKAASKEAFDYQGSSSQSLGYPNKGKLPDKGSGSDSEPHSSRDDITHIKGVKVTAKVSVPSVRTAPKSTMGQ